MKVDLGQIGSVIGWAAAGVSAVYGAIKGYTDGRNLITDWIESRRDPAGYKVRATVSKTVIRKDRTEYIRLRTVRANRKVGSLKIDHWPIIVQPDGKERPAAISNHYAMPGRATLSPDEMFQIDLMEDEALSAHKDHSVVLGYIMEEKQDVLFTPPGVSVVPPVGDYLVIEVHFPAGCLLSLNINDQPQIRFYAKDSRTKKETDILWPTRLANVKFPEHERNWIRASVNKPPQDCEICVDWQWQCS